MRASMSAGAIIEMQKMFGREAQKLLAQRPRAPAADVVGRRLFRTPTTVVIGSQTPVDASYCVVETEVDYVPPSG